MKKLMLSLVAMAALTSSAQAQSLEVAKCGYIEIRANEQGSYDLVQTAFNPSSVFRVASLLTLGQDLIQNGSIDVQTQEPVSRVQIETAIDPTTQTKIAGQYEVSMYDYRFEYDTKGAATQVATRWANEGSQCNAAANRLLKQAIQLALSAK